jgi:large-conductance mechanosensitive channel
MHYPAKNKYPLYNTMSIPNKEESQGLKKDIEDIQQKGSAELTLRNIYNDFQQFMFSNKIMIGATSFAIGVATKDVVEQLTTLLILPVLKTPFLYIQKSLLQSSLILNLLEKQWINTVSTTLGYASWAIFLWLSIIVSVFFLLEYFLNRTVIGITSQVTDSQEKDFRKAKVGAKETVIPLAKEDVEQAKSKLIEEKVKDYPGFDQSYLGFGSLE